MTARDTYQASVLTAGKTQATQAITNETIKQTTIDASRSVVGYTLQTGNMANLQSAVNNANKALVVAAILAEHNKQVAINNARDLLRDSGDKAPS